MGRRWSIREGDVIGRRETKALGCEAVGLTRGARRSTFGVELGFDRLGEGVDLLGGGLE